MEFPSGVAALMNPHAVQRELGFTNPNDWHWHNRKSPEPVIGVPVSVNITPQGVYAHIMRDGIFAVEKVLFAATADEKRQLKEWFAKRNIPCHNNIYRLPW